MFWKRKAKCPITLDDKEWLETQLKWIDENILKLKDQKTILPTKEYFDWEFKGEEEDALYVLKKIGSYFKVNTQLINIEFYTEEPIELDRGTITQQEEGTGTAGIYLQGGNEHTILIEVQQLKNPHSLIATLAHELSHYVLLGQHNFRLEGEENEWLTDLLAIAYGFGIFIGNSKFEFSQWHSGDGWGGWQYSTQGYLPQQIIAYAMAEIEIKRSQELPDWIDLLKKDFKHDFKNSMRYLLSINSTE